MEAKVSNIQNALLAAIKTLPYDKYKVALLAATNNKSGKSFLVDRVTKGIEAILYSIVQKGDLPEGVSFNFSFQDKARKGSEDLYNKYISKHEAESNEPIPEFRFNNTSGKPRSMLIDTMLDAIVNSIKNNFGEDQWCSLNVLANANFRKTVILEEDDPRYVGRLANTILSLLLSNISVSDKVSDKLRAALDKNYQKLLYPSNSNTNGFTKEPNGSSALNRGGLDEIRPGIYGFIENTSPIKINAEDNTGEFFALINSLYNIKNINDDNELLKVIESAKKGFKSVANTVNKYIESIIEAIKKEINAHTNKIPSDDNAIKNAIAGINNINSSKDDEDDVCEKIQTFIVAINNNRNILENAANKEDIKELKELCGKLERCNNAIKTIFAFLKLMHKINATNIDSTETSNQRPDGNSDRHEFTYKQLSKRGGNNLEKGFNGVVNDVADVDHATGIKLLGTCLFDTFRESLNAIDKNDSLSNLEKAIDIDMDFQKFQDAEFRDFSKTLEAYSIKSDFARNIFLQYSNSINNSSSGLSKMIGKGVNYFLGSKGWRIFGATVFNVGKGLLYFLNHGGCDTFLQGMRLTFGLPQKLFEQRNITDAEARDIYRLFRNTPELKKSYDRLVKILRVPTNTNKGQHGSNNENEGQTGNNNEDSTKVLIPSILEKIRGSSESGDNGDEVGDNASKYTHNEFARMYLNDLYVVLSNGKIVSIIARFTRLIKPKSGIGSLDKNQVSKFLSDLSAKRAEAEEEISKAKECLESLLNSKYSDRSNWKKDLPTKMFKMVVMMYNIGAARDASDWDINMANSKAMWGNFSDLSKRLGSSSSSSPNPAPIQSPKPAPAPQPQAAPTPATGA